MQIVADRCTITNPDANFPAALEAQSPTFFG